MECADESTPHEETRVYSSILEGGEIMQKFEGDEPMNPQVADAHQSVSYPVRSEGKYVTPTNPWPRDQEKETRDMTSVQKRKPHVPRGNRWDQYGEASSATSSEAHITSDPMNSESTWGPWEQAGKDKRLAQPYRLQQANKSDGQWSRWVCDI